VTGKPRILVLQGQGKASPLARCEPEADLVRADSVPSAIALLQRERFDGVYADTSDLALLRRAGSIIQADRILEALVDGVVLVDPDLRIVWANAEFRKWCQSAQPVEGKTFYEALGSPEILGPEYSPFHTALSHGPVFTRLHAPNGRFLQLHVTPVRNPRDEISHYIGVGRDITEPRGADRAPQVEYPALRARSVAL
jgi:PAS domain-containing protein